MLQALADHAAIALSNSDLLARLEASETSFRSLVQATPDVIWRNDAEGRFTFMAEGAEQLFGWTADDLVGRHFADIVAPESQADAGEAWQQLITTPGAVWRLRFVLVRKDGTPLPGRGVRGHELRRHASSAAPRARSATSASGSAWNASCARPRSATAASSSRRRTSSSRWTATASTPSTPTGPRRSSAGRPGEMIGRPFTDFIDMEAFPHAAQRIAEIAANPGKPSTDRLLIRHKHGGRTIPFEVSVVGQVDELGQLAAIRGVARDISERERLENQLRASEERYRFLVENAPDVVFSADAQTRFLFFSDTIEQLTGFRPEELIGETFDKIITPETMPVALERWKRDRGRPEPVAGPAHRGPRTRTAAPCRSRSTPSARSTARAGSPASTARPATSASGSASRPSCARPRSATGR